MISLPDVEIFSLNSKPCKNLFFLFYQLFIREEFLMRGRFKFREDYVYKMPVHFGGHQFYPVRTVYGDITGISIRYETKSEALLQYIPEDFELLEPVVNVQYSNCRDVDWMTGGEYRLIQVTVPVKYLGNTEGLTGDYALVVWENKACPIIGGREEDGVPKIFADIAAERHKEDHWFTAASYESHTFLKFDFFRKEEVKKEDVQKINIDSRINLFAWRYIPNLGRGGASLSHATLYPQSSRTERMWTGEGFIGWTRLSSEQHPLQWYIIEALSELPVVKYLKAVMIKGTSQLNVGDSRILP